MSLKIDPIANIEQRMKDVTDDYHILLNAMDNGIVTMDEATAIAERINDQFKRVVHDFNIIIQSRYES